MSLNRFSIGIFLPLPHRVFCPFFAILLSMEARLLEWKILFLLGKSFWGWCHAWCLNIVRESVYWLRDIKKFALLYNRLKQRFLSKINPGINFSITKQTQETVISSNETRDNYLFSLCFTCPHLQNNCNRFNPPIFLFQKKMWDLSQNEHEIERMFSSPLKSSSGTAIKNKLCFSTTLPGRLQISSFICFSSFEGFIFILPKLQWEFWAKNLVLMSSECPLAWIVAFMHPEYFSVFSSAGIITCKQLITWGSPFLPILSKFSRKI